MGERGLKVLVANRGEISVRIIRAAHELALETIAIYAEQDRFAGHRHKADRAFMIGQPGEFGPVEAYLAKDVIVEIAKEKNVDLIHPGYGFLSENAAFATAVRQAGIVFVGPPTEVIAKMGDKVTARKAATACGIPVVPGTEGPLQDVAQAHRFIQRHGLPVVVKASFGGGGRGMRVIRQGESVENAIAGAKSEAEAAFGDGSVFLEKYLDKPKHIEVQILADRSGDCIHLFERDCSVQRKHQKIIEVAPAPNLSPTLKEEISKAAVMLARSMNYENAGTVEFLVAEDKFFFIEMNPRIQVEHTVTEEVTGVDIVSAQLQVAMGRSLRDIGLTQDSAAQRGFAIQCRVTTEVPAESFRPDTGTIEFCRLPTGHGIRLDSSDLLQGAVVTPHFDPLLIKCTFTGPTLGLAIQKALRSLRELHVRGVETNIEFLIKILQTVEFQSGECWTTFIDDNPHLVLGILDGDRATKFLRFLADSAVNGSRVEGQTKPPGYTGEIPIGRLLSLDSSTPIDVSTVCAEGWREYLLREGPAKFAKRVREHSKTLLTDTTWRDGQQSLLATRVRTIDLAAIARHTSYAFRNAYSMENWGGATFDVAMRFLFEDPWERLRTIRKLIPNIPFQMLLRSTNGVAYSALPDNAIYHFVKHAKDSGVDIFRVFDSLNNIENLEVGIKAALQAGGVVEGAIMYTGDMLKPGKYNLEYYMSVADKLVELGSHVIAIKSMSGVMKPVAGRTLVHALRTKYPDIPIHVHVHDNNGAGVATYLACVEAGADIIDTAIDSLSGSTSQPAMSSTVAALEGSRHETEMSLDYIEVIDNYWSQLRLMYSGFDADLRSPDPAIYKHEIPGGQYSNLLFQARQNGLGGEWRETLQAYEHANHLLGDIIKATPTSKAVGDLAQFMVDNKLTPDEVLRQAATLDFPTSVLDYFEGLMGQPFDGFPEPFRTHVLGTRRAKMSCRPGLLLKPVDFDQVRRTIQALFPDRPPTEDDVASYIMYPDVYQDYRRFLQDFGDPTNLATPNFLVPPGVGDEVSLCIDDGKELVAVLVNIGPADTRTGRREVLFRLNGELRSVSVVDAKVKPQQARPRADPHNQTHVAAPMSGKVIRITVKAPGSVAQGDALLAISAMKMELTVTAKRAGSVQTVLVAVGDTVEKGDLLLEVGA